MPHDSVEYTDHPPPPEYSLAFDPYLYNQESFLQLKSYPIQSFYALAHSHQMVLARIHFTLEPKPEGQCRAISLPEVPFASWEYQAGMNQEQLTRFVAYVLAQLARRRVTVVAIYDCIPAYRPDQGKLLKRTLLTQGFVIQEKIRNHHIPVDERALVTKIHRMEAKRLRKCHRAKFYFVQEPITQLEAVYRFLEYCRAERGWKLSVSFEQLQRTARELPAAYQLFSVYHDHRRIAASLLVMVNERIVYDFYHDALQSYNRYSPTVMLVEGLYQYCQRQKIEVLDMGTSASANVGAFKEHVGGVASQKLVYHLTL